MKKAIALALSLTMALSLAACGPKDDGGKSSASDGSKSPSVSSSAPKPSGSVTKVTLATGGPSGTYYAVGGVLSTVLNGKLELSEINPISTGASKANIYEVTDGNAQMSILQSDVLTYAHAGTDLFEADGADKNSLWVAGLYNETVQVIATTDITDISQLKGKAVCVGDVGSGTEFNAMQVLEAYEMTFDDIKKTNGSFGDAVENIKDGKVAAAFTVAGAPTTSIVDLASSNKFNMLSLSDDAVTYLTANYPFLVQDNLPANTYNGIDYEVVCVAVKAVLTADKNLSEDVVYEFTKALFENQAELATGHGKFENLSPESAVDGASVEIHPGAAKYYKEVGVLA